MNDKTPKPDMPHWQTYIKDTVATLRSLSPEQFYDRQTYRNHAVLRDVGVISQAFKSHPSMLQHLLDHSVHTGECWLPLVLSDLEVMTATEIYCRLKINIAGQRWVEGALVKSFESGTLARALEIIAANPEEFELSEPASND